MYICTNGIYSNKKLYSVAKFYKTTISLDKDGVDCCFYEKNVNTSLRHDIRVHNIIQSKTYNYKMKTHTVDTTHLL